MSGAEKLREKILSEAKKEAEKTLAEARSRAAEILADGEKKAAAQKEAILESAKTMAEEKKRRSRTIEDLDSRKELLSAKEEMIEETFRKALERLQDSEAKLYQELLLPMLVAASEKGDEEIIVSPRDLEMLDAGFLSKVNEQLVQQGKKGNLTLSAQTRNMQGGFVLRAGEVEINSSFDSILRMQRDQLEPEVAAILFAE